MKLRYYLRGLGIGMLVTALILHFTTGSASYALSDQEIKERAMALGMVESGTLAGNKNAGGAAADASGDPKQDMAAGISGNETRGTVSGAESSLSGNESMTAGIGDITEVTGEVKAGSVSQESISDPKAGVEAAESLSDAQAEKKQSESVSGAGADKKQSESVRASEADQKAEEEARKAEEEIAKKEAEKKADEAALKAEEERKAEEASKKAEEAKKAAEEAKKADEAAEKKVTETETTDHKTTEAETSEVKTSEKKTTEEETDGESSEAGTGNVSVTIIKGDSSYTAARRLAEAGLVESAAAFDEYLCRNNYDRYIRTGVHVFPEGADYEQLAKILVSNP